MDYVWEILRHVVYFLLGLIFGGCLICAVFGLISYLGAMVIHFILAIVLPESERKEEACRYGLAHHVLMTIGLIIQALTALFILWAICSRSYWDSKTIASSAGCFLFSICFLFQCYYEDRQLYLHYRQSGKKHIEGKGILNGAGDDYNAKTFSREFNESNLEPVQDSDINDERDTTVDDAAKDYDVVDADDDDDDIYPNCLPSFCETCGAVVKLSEDRCRVCGAALYG